MSNNLSESILIDCFSRNLRKQRELKGFSQEELAGKAGLDRTYISGCERGVRNISLRSLEKIANALSISPETLLHREEV